MAIPRMLTQQEVADVLRCPKRTVRFWTPHKLPAIKAGRRWLYAEDDVRQFLEANRRGPKPPRRPRRAEVTP